MHSGPSTLLMRVAKSSCAIFERRWETTVHVEFDEKCLS